MQLDDNSPLGTFTAAAERPEPCGGWELEVARRVLEHARQELTTLQASAADSASIAAALRRYRSALHLAQRVQRASGPSQPGVLDE